MTQILKEKFKRWFKNESPNVPDGISRMTYPYRRNPQECRAEYFITNGCEYKDFKETNIDISNYLFVIYPTIVSVEQHICNLNSYIHNGPHKSKIVYDMIKKIDDELYPIAEDMYDYLLKCKYRYILYNFFMPVDGDYIIRGQIGDFMYELDYARTSLLYNKDFLYQMDYRRR